MNCQSKTSAGLGALLGVGLFLIISAAAFAAGDREVAEASITPGQVTWRTIADAQSWTLSVSGQGIYLRERYEDGETPTLRPVGPDGERFPDGRYNWELRAIRPSEQDRLMKTRALARQRQVRTERGTFERRIVERPVVTSGSFRILNGGFVIPPSESEELRLR